MAGMYERDVEGVADEIAGLNTTPMYEVDDSQCEGAAAGLELAAGADDDLGWCRRWRRRS